MTRHMLPGFVPEQTPQRGLPPPPGFVPEDEPVESGSATGPYMPYAGPGAPPLTGKQSSQMLGQLGGFGRSVLKGALYAGADEAVAGAESIIGGGTYEEELAYQRAQDEKIPASVAIPGQILGGMATAIPIVKGASALMKAGKAAYQIPGWLKAALAGGAAGGAYGFGEGEGGLGPRTRGSLVGAGLGAVTGAGLYPVGVGIQKGVKKVGEAIRARIAPEATARAKIAEAIQRDEMTPGKVRSRLGELGPQATIADAGGRNVRALAGDVARTPGPAQNRAEIMLNQRAEGETARIAQAVKKGLDPQDYYAAEEAFLGNLRTRAAPFYEQAYEKYQSITSRALNRLLNSKNGQKALREAAEIIENERASGAASYLGKVDEEITAAARSAADVGKMEKMGQPGVLSGLSLRAWDQIKRGFDSLLDSPAYRNELTGRLNTRGRSVDQMRRTLLKELDKATGGDKSIYAKARATYAGDAEAVGALREGRKLLRKDPEIISRDLADLSDAGREAYRSGVARALMDEVSKVVDKGSAAGRIFSNARKRAQIRAAFPDRKSYDLLRKSLVAEQQFTKLHRETLGGSQTQPRQVQHEDALTRAGGIAGVMTAGVGPGHTLLKAGIFRKIGQSLLGGDVGPHNLAMAKTLFNRNQAMNQHALDTLFDPVVWEALPDVAKQRLGQALLMGSAQQEGGLAARYMNQSGQNP